MALKSKEEDRIISELNANWIWVADWVDTSTENTAGKLVSFNRKIQLSSKPQAAELHISADTRYKLWINGKHVAVGPSRGSPQIWFYDSLDIAQHLREGDNEIRIDVLRYFAANRAAMPFGRTSFPGLTVFGIVEDGCKTQTIRSRDVENWQAEIHEELTFPTGTVHDVFLHIYERVSSPPKRTAAIPTAYGFKTLNGDLLPWRLRPRMIPMPELKSTAVTTVRKCEGSVAFEDWTRHFSSGQIIRLPARSSHCLELQADVHSTAYLSWRFRAAADGEMKINTTYSEGYELEPRSYPFFRSKGDRTKIEGGHIIGPCDDAILRLKAGEETTYQPFWFRTFRIIRLELTVGEAPVDFLSLMATQANYPLNIKAKWQQTPDLESKQMWDVSVRTLQNCMFDGYSDCPFYEQLQYSMDSRAVGLFHYLLAGDDRLMRQAITHFASSNTVEGLPQSRFPSHVNQLIAGFPLYWILAICDHHLYFGDTNFTRSLMPRIDGVFEFFDRYIDERGLVSGLPRDVWQFVDWVTTWHATEEHPDKGVPTSGRKTNCHTYFTMLLAYVLRHAARLSIQIGRPGFANEYTARAEMLCEAVRKHCYKDDFFTDSTADVADELSFSQQCQVWAVLSEAAPNRDHERLLTESFSGTTSIKFSKCSYMMQFYAMEAFAVAGDEVYERQWQNVWKPWKAMLANNLTTWEEDDVRQRSDCHAWGSLPIYEFCTELAGIQVISPGAKKILFKPRLRLQPQLDAVVALGKDNTASIRWQTSENSHSVDVSLQLGRRIQVISILPGEDQVDHGSVDKLTLRWSHA